MAVRMEIQAVLDGSGFKAGVSEMERVSSTASARMAKSMDVIAGRTGGVGKAIGRREYVDELKGYGAADKAAAERQRLADVDAAKRSIEARRLLREREQDRTAREQKAWKAGIDRELSRPRPTPTANPIFGDLLPSEQTKRDILRQQLLLRKQIRDGQSKIPNLIFQDTAQEAATKAKAAGMAAGGAYGMAGGRVASTMFVSAIRDSFASLASGMSPVTVFLQQAPQVAQGFAMMGLEALKAAAKWIGLVAAGIALAGTIYWVIKRLTDAAAAQKNFRDLTDTSNTSIATQIQLLKESAKAHQEHIDWLKKRGAAESVLKEQTDDALASLRKQLDFEKQLASARGAKPAQLAQMDIALAEAELKMLEAAKLRADEEQRAAFKAVQEAEASRNRFSGSPQAEELGTAREKIKDAEAVLKAIGEKMKGDETILDIDPVKSSEAGRQIFRRRALNERDVLDVEVNGKKYSQSLAAARDALNGLTSIEALLGGTEKDVAETLKTRIKTLEDADKNLKALDAETKKATEDLALKKQFLPAIGAAKGGLPEIKSDALTSVGNFLGSSRNMISSMEQRKLDLLARIEQNTRPATATGGGPATTWPSP